MLRNRLHRLGQLSPRERWWLFQALLLLPLVHLALLLLGYARLRGLVERLLPLKASRMSLSEAELLARALSCARVVSIAAAHGLYRAGCLRRSLLLWGLLRREGVQSQIRFGVRVCGRRLEAHAWVECNGAVLDEAPDVFERYTPLHGALPPSSSG